MAIPAAAAAAGAVPPAAPPPIIPPYVLVDGDVVVAEDPLPTESETIRQILLVI
eukprot:CAMPEP_0203656788 /NCGR_PEP_ID=MMETSP0088-20131115/42567_1 /ASSEMBLY_ACC=CAM_ASM_001087 /TAXON_ID=426623 /ORGANISM="Chaetoceros affinis, Strain CCMP159" /LENGTH=53 /DNA_ID=CAMNT_0050517865 /DNA_START=13 /DNA_END=174 /DNA_ORIENTATION=+